jgi:hypothetical protein
MAAAFPAAASSWAAQTAAAFQAVDAASPPVVHP